MSIGADRIGLALSGGGARAIAFHLGCLRALRDLGLLSRIDVISSVSGGSVISALYCSFDETFEAFEARVRNLLMQGLTPRIVRQLFSSAGLRATLSLVLALAVALPLGIVQFIAVALASGWEEKAAAKRRFAYAGVRRTTRTDLFEKVLASGDLLGSTTFAEMPQSKPELIINAADLRSQTAFRFTAAGAGSWRTGMVNHAAFRLSEAVAASAGFPVLLPSLDRTFAANPATGSKEVRVLLTDGGIYDNLGVQAFDPVRPPGYAFGVTHVDYIIACIAEPGLPTGEALPIFWGDRLLAAFNTVHRQLHRSSMGALHSWRASRGIKGFVMPYLGQDDAKLPSVAGEAPPPPLGALRDYPADFSPMPESAATALIARGEAQTRHLVLAYLSPLLPHQAEG